MGKESGLVSMSALITLTTDFGLNDGYVGAMKGVILSILPSAQIVDISHHIAPQNVAQAAFVLATAAPYFRHGTTHVAVVDPGVGSDRRPIAVFTETAAFVGPDNGIFSRVYQTERVAQIRLLANTNYHLPDLSLTFHGRDLFAPVAAHIARGAPPSSLGPEVTDPVVLPVHQAERCDDGGLRGQVVYVDHFGNLITDIPSAWLAADTAWTFTIGELEIVGFNLTYGRVPVGELLVLGGSSGWVEVAVRNGSAAARLGLGEGAVIQARVGAAGPGQSPGTGAQP